MRKGLVFPLLPSAGFSVVGIHRESGFGKLAAVARVPGGALK